MSDRPVVTPGRALFTRCQACPEDAELICTVLGTGGVPQQARRHRRPVRRSYEEAGGGRGGGEGPRESLQAEVTPPPDPFHSHKAGFVSIYLLDFSAKMLLGKHIALM